MDRKKERSNKKNLKKGREKKFHKSSSLLRGICKNVNFNTWNRNEPIITQKQPERKESERKGMHAWVRTYVYRSDGDGSNSGSNREGELRRGCGIQVNPAYI